MVLLRYEKVKALLGNHNILPPLITTPQQILQHEKSNAKKINQIMTDAFNQNTKKIKRNMTGALHQNTNSETRQSYRWPAIFFILPLLEHALIFLLVALILTSYNLNPLGCFFHTLHYNEMTETVLLKASRTVYI